MPRKENKNQFDVIVVGGGASGLMAAGRAAEQGARVLLLEKNKKLGEKLRISGDGRCNITNAELDQRKLLEHYGPAKDFLFSPFSQFGIKDTFKFFESRGLPLVVEARNRAFPATQSADDVAKVLEKYLQENEVVVRKGAKVSRIGAADGMIKSLTVDGEKIMANNFILATGGLSHPETGSTGDGFRWLKQLGHTIKEPTPDVVPLSVADEWVKSLSGVSLSFMKITFFSNNKKSFSKTGKILFTHFGLSGPLILNSARAVRDLLYNGSVTAEIDAFPDTDLGSLEKHILKVFDVNKNKDLKNVFGEIAPHGTAEAILPLLPGLLGETKVHSVTKEDRKQIARLLKALPLSITGLMGYDRAVVSDGGVLLQEIDTRTMRSRLIRNLFVTGDLLHVNRQSGGYSLQLCWTTGLVAGDHSSRKEGN